MKRPLLADSSIQSDSEIIKTIHRKTRFNDFTILPNKTLKDKRLSFRARGVLAMMLAMPDNWQTYAEWIEDQGTEGREALQSSFRELEKFGYLSRQRVLDPVTKKFKCYQWSWFDEPYDGFPSDGFPADGKPAATKYQLNQGQNNQETKESAFLKAEKGFLLKDKPESKLEKLKNIQEPEGCPSAREFAEFIAVRDLHYISDYRPDLYETLSKDKWHVWRNSIKQWTRIINWQKFLTGLDAKIERQKNKQR